MSDPMSNEPPQTLKLDPIVQTSAADRWKTEAMRSHATPRLIYMNRGQGRIIIAGQISSYSAHSVIFIPANTMYGYEAGPMVFGAVLNIPNAMASEWPNETVHVRLRDVHAQKEIANLFDNLDRELNSEKPGRTRAAHYHTGILSVFLERQMDVLGPELARFQNDTPAARLVAAFTDLVERDYKSRKGVADYASDLGVTPTHLTRCCNETCGASALALLTDRIMHEARRLLRDTDHPVQNIAANLGFGSAAYFTRSFQSQTGETPSGFRKADGTEPSTEAH